MKTRTALVSALLFLSVVYAPLSAAQQTWSKTLLAPTIYSAGTENSSFFSQGGLLPANTITGVSWNVGLYTNGATNQDVRLCYTPPVGVAPPCLNIRNRLVDAANNFNGQPARGQFRITYVLTGGTYPVNPTHSNTVTVTFQ